MPSFEIADYQVFSILGSGSGTGGARILYLFASTDEGPEHFADFYFLDGGANPPPPEAQIWDIAADGRMRISGYCHLEDFADTYRVLNTEKPTHFAWLAESDGESPLISWDVRSDREPVGEGPADADAKKKWVPQNWSPPNWSP